MHDIVDTLLKDRSSIAEVDEAGVGCAVSLVFLRSACSSEQRWEQFDKVVLAECFELSILVKSKGVIIPGIEVRRL